MEHQKFAENPEAVESSSETTGKWYHHINFFISILIVIMLVAIAIQAQLR